MENKRHKARMNKNPIVINNNLFSNISHLFLYLSIINIIKSERARIRFSFVLK